MQNRNDHYRNFFIKVINSLNFFCNWPPVDKFGNLCVPPKQTEKVIFFLWMKRMVGGPENFFYLQVKWLLTSAFCKTNNSIFVTQDTSNFQFWNNLLPPPNSFLKLYLHHQLSRWQKGKNWQWSWCCSLLVAFVQNRARDQAWRNNNVQLVEAIMEESIVWTWRLQKLQHLRG